MKKILIAGLMLGCSLISTFAFAKVSVEASEPPATPPVAKPVPVDPKKEEAKLKAIQKKRAELNGTQWEVTLIPKDPKEKSEQDVLRFENDTISSENLTKRGFNSTNYTVSVPNEKEERALFETMQTGKEGYAFIRGEWTKDAVNGAIHEQLDGGKQVKEYYFNSAKRSALKAEEKTEDKNTQAKNQPVSAEKTLVSKEAPKVTSKKR